MFSRQNLSFIGTTVLLVLGGCAQRGTRVTVSRPAEPFLALAVLPMELAYESEPNEPALRSEDLLAVLWSASEWAVVTPREFTLQEARTRDFLHGTDLVVRAAALQLDPKHMAMLRSRISINEARNEAQTLAQAILTLELIDGQGATIAEIETRQDLDPFAEHPSDDARPELRIAIREATTALVQACGDCLVKNPRPEFAVKANPAVLIDNRPREDDDLGREQAMLSVMHYFDDEMPMLEARRLAGLGGGACLLEDAAADLHAGDCILGIDGDKLDGPHALARALARNKPLRLRVVSPEGQERELTLAPH